jgi:hypothetical protein
VQKPLAACQGKTVPGAVLLVALGQSVPGGPPRFLAAGSRSADVARQFAEEKGDLRLFKRRRLQGSQVVPQNRRPGVAAAHGVIKPLAGPLLVTKAVGSQEELLQLPVRVGDGGGVSRQRVDGGDQREGQLRHGPVEFRDRLGDVCRGKGGIEEVEPTMRRIGVKIG